jgi:tetratricopeptide (TPR) repeat protein
MPEDRRFAHAFQVAAVAAAAFAVECFIVRACFLPGTQWWIPLSAHLGLTSALCLWLCYAPGLRADVRLPLLLIGTTAALGPLGPAGTLATAVLARWYMRKAAPFEDWYRALFPDNHGEAGNEFASRLAHSADPDNPSGIAPFAEVLAFGSLQQKQALIALINQSFRPAFGPVLKRALTDTNNVIRVQAATAMNKIEKGIHERTLQLTREVSQNPGNPDALRELARHYDSWLYSSILDARREEEVRARALDAYRRYLAARPDDSESRIAISRLLLRSGRYSEAATSLEKAMQAGLSTSQAELWYMESLYNLGRFTELHEYARPRQDRIENADGLTAATIEAVRMWAQDPVEVEAAGAVVR